MCSKVRRHSALGCRHRWNDGSNAQGPVAQHLSKTTRQYHRGRHLQL